MLYKFTYFTIKKKKIVSASRAMLNKRHLAFLIANDKQIAF